MKAGGERQVSRFKKERLAARDALDVVCAQISHALSGTDTQPSAPVVGSPPVACDANVAIEARNGGMALVAKRDIAIGETLFEESPVLFARVGPDDDDVHRKLWAAFLALKKTARDEVLEFHADFGDKETPLFRGLAGEIGLAAEHHETFTRVSLIMKHNAAVYQQPTEVRLALSDPYNIISK